MTVERTARLLQELIGDRCRCGSIKKQRQTFCRACYFKLSPDARRELYRRVGEGYEQAYDAATLQLDNEVQPRPPSGELFDRGSPAPE